MAVIETSGTKRIANLIRYCSNPEKCGVVSGWNLVNPANARLEMLTTRKIWNKNGGRQGHHVIQSFSPADNITPEQANRIGLKLAQKIGPDYEIAIYTHIDKGHIHNHLVINSVSFVNGKKFHQTNYKNGKSQSGSINLSQIKKYSDDLCRENGLSVIDKSSARTRKSMAERQIEARGDKPWKSDLRAAITEAQLSSASMAEIKQKLAKEHIEMYIRGQNISFRYPGQKRNVRGKNSGEDYTKSAIEKFLSKQKPIDSGKAWENLKSIRQEMKAENDPIRKSELQKQFENAKIEVEQSRKIFSQNKSNNRTKAMDRER